MSMTSELSASDVALLSGRNSNQNGDGMFGGNGAWWIIILFLFVFCGWGNNSWGGFGNRNGGRVLSWTVTSSPPTSPISSEKLTT